MSDKTQIGWTDATWNVLVGCTKISAGCQNCSALRDAQRLQFNPNAKIAAKYAGTVSSESGKPNWSGQINFSRADLLQPLRWARPRKIFPNYTSDWAHDDVLDSWRDQMFAVMALANQHTYQLLTKRADNALRYIAASERLIAIAREGARVMEWAKLLADGVTPARAVMEFSAKFLPWPLPLPHVWLGFSVESQSDFDNRWQYFREIAARGWTVTVSAEPLLSRVDLPADFLALGPRTQVIAGGESGGKARISNPDDFRRLRYQCVEAGVRFFFKQWGEFAPSSHVRRLGLSPGEYQMHSSRNEDGSEGWVYRIGKKRAGHLLDGVAWEQFPER